MTVELSEQVLEEIDAQRRALGDALGINPDEVPPYEWGYDTGFFPDLEPGLLDKIEQGEARDSLAQTIDHTLLKPEATPEKISELCADALDHRFYAACVNGCHVSRACTILGDSGVQLAAVVGFPLGQMATPVKAYEAKLAVEEGAGEIDMVINIGQLKDGLFREVFEDIHEVVRAAAVPVKVILETCLLSDDEKIISALLARFAGAAFLKTSTGFSTGGATEYDVALLRAVVGDGAGVKASGGVRTLEDTVKMLRAGANRIGTSSGVKIMG